MLPHLPGKYPSATQYYGKESIRLPRAGDIVLWDGLHCGVVGCVEGGRIKLIPACLDKNYAISAPIYTTDPKNVQFVERDVYHIRRYAALALAVFCLAWFHKSVDYNALEQFFGVIECREINFHGVCAILDPKVTHASVAEDQDSDTEDVNSSNETL